MAKQLKLIFFFCLLGISTVYVNAQQNTKRTITGTILDDLGDPLVGATVAVPGTSIGTAADIDGKFTLSIPTETKTVKVSFVGYETQNVSVTNKSTISVTLASSYMLDVVEIVEIGYGSAKRGDLTGAITSVRAGDITATPTSNIMEALQGRIAGADIMKPSGEIGSGVDILLRGNRSIYGSNSPLFIIDGVQGADYNQIDPYDIETMDVLKDASSTAIYGAAGANGVIIITTKRAKESRVRVNLNAYHSFSGEANFIHGMTGNEYLKYQREFYRTRNGEYPETMEQLFSNEDKRAAIENGQWIDWVDEATKGNSSKDYLSLSINGGSDRAKIYSSITYEGQNGLLPNENQNRYGFRLNGDYKVNKMLKVGLTSSVTYTIRNNRGKNIFTKAIAAEPLGLVYDEYGNLNEYVYPGSATIMGDFMKDQYSDNTRSTYVNASGYAEFKPIKDLTFRSQIATVLSNSRNGKYVGARSLQNVETGYITPYAYIKNNYSYGYSWENVLTYNKTFLKNHNVILTGITSWSKHQGDWNDMRAHKFPLDSYQFHNMASSENQAIKSGYTQKQTMSYALRFNYSYKSRYLFTFTTRWDGASHLAEGHKWDAFPAGAIAWRVSDEAFMESTESWLGNLKLRASYGVTGNSGGMGAYASQTGVTTYQKVSADGEVVSNSQMVSPYANPAIGWEKSYTLDLGVDISLFRNRINLTFDYYNTDTKDLLFQRKLPITSALTAWGSPLNTWQNIGETNNRGFEIELKTSNIRNKDFEWTTALSFSKNKEKIVSLPDGDLLDSRLFEGQPIRVFYDYKYLGVWSEAEAEEAAKYGVRPGAVKIQTIPHVTIDADGNEVSDNGVHNYSSNYDKQILGSRTPDGIVGFNNTFHYKNFDLSIYAVLRWGQMIESKALGWFSAGSDNQPAGTKYWTPENQNTYFPRPGVYAGIASTGIESLKFIDGSYAKIKNITLGYTVPRKWLKKIGVEKLRVYGTAYNSLILPFKSELKKTDPENNGSDTFPLYKEYVIGVNVSF
ncbi:TonB-dependent receptor [Bacteroides sp. 214]|uniref:SusC/RagA family TonB-linked outer membrane protein n=1 Tax=Bacteroides sp. 214 TaxID=2302935 RepID=UPI0013D125ED|nr:TonB-dependent receptor [Bacteroides sp. 214]NDW12837.1 TonB-dependent receptor [Bacteroides sp. 214]